MNEQELRDRLLGFGLSEKEVDTYFVVLEHGEAKVSVIAEESDVSQRYVYNIAEQLEDRGLVEVHDHVIPTTVEANPPDEAIDTLVGRLRSIVPRLEQRFSTPTENATSVEVFKSRQTVLKKIRELVGSAEKEVFLSVPSSVVPDLRKSLRNALDRDASVLLLETDVDPDPEDAVQRLGDAASVVRQWPEDSPFVATADNDAGIVGERQMLVGSHDDRQAVAIRQAQLVGSMFGSFMSSFWPMGTEVYVTEADPLPQTHTMFRPAVLQATLHRREGTDLRFRAEATGTDDEREREVVGPVVEVRQGLVDPTTNSFPIENTILVESDEEGVVSFGGEGAFIEDYYAEEVTIERA